MRYFLTLSYLGTAYHGWQMQPNAPSVQETLQKALGRILGGDSCAVTGCGRTDTGVHASYYVAHFDTEKPLPLAFLKGINSILPPDIAVQQVVPITQTDADENLLHARYSATLRCYEYHITGRKDPFSIQTAWFYPLLERLDKEKLTSAAALIRSFDAFFPFCKSDSGADHYRCQVENLHWEFLPERQQLVLHISANRFLRGMVRLITGACVQVANGQMALTDLEKALREQTVLPKSLSVPPHGLFLTDVQYPIPALNNRNRTAPVRN
jgi:tRNA pseudouridine38-40 synthase